MHNEKLLLTERSCLISNLLEEAVFLIQNCDDLLTEDKLSIVFLHGLVWMIV